MLTGIDNLASSIFLEMDRVALGYLGLNNKEQVFAWLERALTVRDVHLIDVPWDTRSVS